MAPGLRADPQSLTGAAAVLHDLARGLNAGQLDRFLLDWAKAPASHPEVDRAMRTFGEFAHDQYQDAVALLAALSTRVADASAAYRRTDGESGQDITELLTGSTYQPADRRTR